MEEIKDTFKNDRVNLDTSNSVIMSILNKGMKDNPEYNPKTKKGRAQPKQIKDTAPKDFRSGIFSGLTNTNLNIRTTIQDLGITDKEYNKYADYDVIPSLYQGNEKDWNRQRAENQSILEQAGNMVVQAVANEIVLGGIKGFSDIADFLINIGKEKGEDDYTNPVSLELEKLQEDIREKFEIYNKNPDDVWGFSSEGIDTGWLFNGLTSIASTASMLIPTLGISKGIGLTSKALKALGKNNKLGKGLNFISADNIAIKAAEKFGDKVKFLSDSGKTADRINMVRTVGGNAILSRTAENYIEARETYKEVERITLDKLKNMSTQEREDFFTINPNLKGKSDEEISQYIASVSADKTFQNDYAMLMMDFLQFKNLSELYKGGSKGMNSKIALALKKEKEKALGITKPTNQKFIDKIKDSDWLFRAKYMATHPLQGVFAIQWSEGFEESFQYIQSEKGKEISETYFDPNFTKREIEDYIKDARFYEQAFWGVIGSIGFTGLGRGFASLHNYIKNKYNDDKETELQGLSESKRRQANIKTWVDETEQFIKNMDILNSKRNPFKPILDENKKPVVDENGVIQYEEISDEELEVRRDDLINDFVSRIAKNAIINGNLDVLKSFIQDTEIGKYINDSLNASNPNSSNEKLAIDKALIDKFNQVSDLFHKNLYNIRNSIHVKNPYIGYIMSSIMTRTNLNLNSLNDLINATNTEIAELIPNGQDYSIYEQNLLNNSVQYALKRFDEQEKELMKKYNDGEISINALNEYIDSLNIQRNALMNFASKNIPLFQTVSGLSDLLTTNQRNPKISELIAKFNEFKSQFQLNNPMIIRPSNAIVNAMKRKHRALYQIERETANLPKNQKEFQEEYDRISTTVDKLVIARYEDASNKVIDWIEKQEDLEKAKKDLLQNNVDSLKDELELIKIGHESTVAYWATIELALKVEQSRRAKEAEERQGVTINGRRATPEQEEAARNALNEEEEKEEEDEEEEEENATTNTTASNNTQPQPQPQINPQQNTGANNNGNQGNSPSTGNGTQTTTRRKRINAAQKEFDSTQFDKAIIGQEAANEATLSADEATANRGYAMDIIKDLYRGDKSLFHGITEVDLNNSKYKALIDAITDKLYLKTGISGPQAINIAEQALKSALRLLRHRDKNLTTLAEAIADKVKFSVTGLLETASDKEIRELALEYFAKYAEIKGIRSKYIKPRINLIKLFQEIVNNEELDSYQKISIFKTMYNLITNERDTLPYRFLNIKVFKNRINHTSKLKDIIEVALKEEKFTAKYMHVNPSKNPKAAAIVAKLDHNSPIDVVYSETTIVKGKEINNNSLSFQVDGEEIGYLAAVDASSDNRTFTPRVANGIKFHARQNEDGTFSLGGLDDLIYRILELEDNENYNPEDTKRLIEIFMYSYATDLTTAQFMFLKNNQWFSDILNYNSNYSYPSERMKYEAFVNAIKNIIDFKDCETNDDILKFYKQFQASVFKNFEFTHKLMKMKTAQVTFRNTWDGKILYDSEKDYDCNSLGFTAENNPLCFVLEKNNIIVEGNDKIYPNPADFDKGTVGFMVRDSDNGIAMALITNSNPLSSNKKLSELIRTELWSIFDEYVHSSDDNAFDTLKHKLVSLFGGAGSTGAIFIKGLEIVVDETHQALGIKLNNYREKKNPNYDRSKDNKFIIKVNKFNPDTHQIQHNIIFRNNKRYTNFNQKALANADGTKRDKFILSITEALISKLEFNLSYINMKQINSKINNNTEYFYVDDNGKIHINIGGVDNVYDSITDFALKENAFRTNQLKINGSYFDTTFGTNSLYIDAEGTYVPSPVKREEKYKSIGGIKRESSKTPIKTKDVLQVLNVNNDIIDFLSGNNEYGLSILPEEIYYNKNSRGDASYSQVTDKISINDKFLNQSKSNPRFAYVKLIHENVHKHFNKLSKEEQTRIIKELSSTYKKTFNSILKDINLQGKLSPNQQRRKELATIIYENLIQKGFTLEYYGGMVSESYKRKYDKLSKNEKAKVFYEEWLTESMTQPALLEYLNMITYSDAIINGIENKSIFQKIIEILLKLFNINSGNIKNRTILAKQFLILNDNKNQTTITNDTILENDNKNNKKENINNENNIENIETETKESNTEIKNENNEESIETKVEAEIEEEAKINDNEDTQNEQTKDENHNIDREDDYYSYENNNIDDDFSVTPLLDNIINEENNISKENYSNLNDFLNKFSSKDRRNIEKLINDNYISFVCK